MRSRDELSRIEALIRSIRGVSGLTKYTAISNRQKHRDKTVARRVKDALRLQHPGAAIEVSVFGGILVLDGRTRSASERRALLKLAARQDGVLRVVDRLRSGKRQRA